MYLLSSSRGEPRATSSTPTRRFWKKSGSTYRMSHASRSPAQKGDGFTSGEIRRPHNDSRELVARTRDNSWTTREFDVPAEESGPLAPLDVIAEHVGDGTIYRLTPASQERITNRFPDTRMAGETFFSTQTQNDYERDHGPVWDQVMILLSGLSMDQVQELGGYRVYQAVGRTLFESATAN